jgi:hypothetical protein
MTIKLFNSHPSFPSSFTVTRFTGTLVSVATLALVAVVSLPSAALPAAASPGQSTTSLRTASAGSLATLLAGEGVSVDAAAATGSDVQAGAYSGMDLGQAGLESGVALSTGSLIDADPAADSDVDFTTSSLLGPNAGLTTTGDLGGAGDADLETLNGGSTTYDAVSLEFTVTPNSDRIELDYLFGSEEYAGWSAQDFSDSFGIWVNGANCALVPGTTDTVGTASINPSTNASLYNANFDGRDAAAGTFDTALNGFTSALTCAAAVTPNVANTVRIALADTRDGQLDSTALFGENSLRSVGTVVPPAAGGGNGGGTTTVPAGTVPTVPSSDTSNTSNTTDSTSSGSDATSLSKTGVDFPLVAALSAGVLILLGGTLIVRRRLRARHTTV